MKSGKDSGKSGNNSFRMQSILTLRMNARDIQIRIKPMLKFEMNCDLILKNLISFKREERLLYT